VEQKTIGKIGKIPINIKSKCFPYWTSDENDFDKDFFMLELKIVTKEKLQKELSYKKFARKF